MIHGKALRTKSSQAALAPAETPSPSGPESVEELWCMQCLLYGHQHPCQAGPDLYQNTFQKQYGAIRASITSSPQAE